MKGVLFCEQRGANMKFARLMITILAGAVSIGFLPSIAAAQVPFDQLPKVWDASVPRAEQISIALSAAPKAIREKATVYVLGPKGFERAREGTNGVSCLVGRHFTKSGETTIEPECYDSEGSRTLLLADLYREELRAKGTPEAEIEPDIENGFKDGGFKVPSKPGVRYMLSSDNRLGPTPDGKTVYVPPHFMFYAPYMTGKDLGYDSVAPFLVQPGKPYTTMIVFYNPNPK